MQHHSLKRRFRAAMVAALMEMATIASADFVTSNIDCFMAQIPAIANGSNLAQICNKLASIATTKVEQELINVWATIAIALSHHQDLAALPIYLAATSIADFDPNALKPLPKYKSMAELEILVLGLAIALCCRDQFSPRSFISNTCDYLGKYLDYLAEQDDCLQTDELGTTAIDRTKQLEQLVSQLWQKLQLVLISRSF
jgi:hypothetical protein